MGGGGGGQEKGGCGGGVKYLGREGRDCLLCSGEHLVAAVDRCVVSYALVWSPATVSRWGSNYQIRAKQSKAHDLPVFSFVLLILNGERIGTSCTNQ